jgi:hypothetical protein
MPEELLAIKLALTPKEAAALTPLGENMIRRLCREYPSFLVFKNGTGYIISRKLKKEPLAGGRKKLVAF